MFSVFSSALVHCRYLASTFFMPLASLVTAVISGRFVSHFFLSFTCCWFLSSIYHAVKSHMCCTALTWFDFNFFLPAEFRLATAKLNEWASEWISKWLWLCVCPHLKAFSSSSSTSIELTAGRKRRNRLTRRSFTSNTQSPLPLPLPLLLRSWGFVLLI